MVSRLTLQLLGVGTTSDTARYVSVQHQDSILINAGSACFEQVRVDASPRASRVLNPVRDSNRGGLFRDFEFEKELETGKEKYTLDLPS